MKEKTLSEKIKVINSFQVLGVYEVKKAIKRLKEELSFKFNGTEKIVDKIFGDKLI